VTPADADHSVMERLAVFLGEWQVQAVFDGASVEEGRGTAVFEWMSGSRLMIERTETAHPAAPDTFAVLAENPDHPGEFVQHYFDSRGVVRLYDMTFDGVVWTLARTRPDFSPLDFKQRYVGTFSADGDTIDGRWEICEQHDDWRVDFPLTHRRRRPR
jgi:hypothetical protein